MKFLILLLLAVVVWLIVKKGGRHSVGTPPRERPAEKMVVCANCGIHLPESDSIHDGELRYCSRAHLEAGAAPRDK